MLKSDFYETIIKDFDDFVGFLKKNRINKGRM